MLVVIQPAARYLYLGINQLHELVAFIAKARVGREDRQGPDTDMAQIMGRKKPAVREKGQG